MEPRPEARALQGWGWRNAPPGLPRLPAVFAPTPKEQRAPPAIGSRRLGRGRALSNFCGCAEAPRGRAWLCAARAGGRRGPQMPLEPRVLQVLGRGAGGERREEPRAARAPPPLRPGSSHRAESLPGPLPAGTPHSVIGWRRGSLARACGCSYKNPRVPALSSSQPAQPSPAQRGRRPECSGRGLPREAGGWKRAGSLRRLPRRAVRAGLPDKAELPQQTSRDHPHPRPAVPRALSGAEHGRGAARALPRGPGRLPVPLL